MREYLELEFIYFKNVWYPKYKWFPFWFKASEEITTIVKGRIQIQDITNVEQITDQDGSIYTNVCSIFLKEIGPRSVNLPYDEMLELVTRKTMGYVGYIVPEEKKIESLDVEL